MTSAISPAAHAFDAIAPEFDSRFGAWQSVATQRRAVRAALIRRFPAGGRILEIGGGTGEDAAFLAGRGFRVLLTDASPAMVSQARAKLTSPDGQAKVVAAEELEQHARHLVSAEGEQFDGAFSNFAALNCVADLNPVARGLARLLKPNAAAMLVVFGSFCPSEMITELLRGRPRNMFRRLQRGAVPARLSGRQFRVTYHRCSQIMRALAPWFVLEERLGIGVTVPPSAAEPWISHHLHLLAAMEALDKRLHRPLAGLGDHILLQFRRNGAPLIAQQNPTRK
jgi:ubiquinone/menaquinone biosynthesis C-methylase UbiE